MTFSRFVPALAILLTAASLGAQENYEIQVYPSATVGRGVTMFELHSNYTLNGEKNVSPFGELPTNHALHETVEITHGFNDFTELGFYWFMAKPDKGDFQWVGTHLRPRISVPESWNWPVGVSLSQEFGWAKSQFSSDTWTYELRPIIDKQSGPLYWSINPVLGKSLRGPNAAEKWEFTPNIDVGYDLTKKLNFSLEYYGDLGTTGEFAPTNGQAHMLFPAINYDFGPEWEFNLGYGMSANNLSDKHIIKMILGRRIGGKQKPE